MLLLTWTSHVTVVVLHFTMMLDEVFIETDSNCSDQLTNFVGVENSSIIMS